MSEKIQVGVDGTWFTWNRERKAAKEIVSVDAFKFVNHVVAWAQGRGGEHMDRARRYVEREVLGIGCTRMRAPVELMFWGPPYFDRADAPNVANTQELVDLYVGTGSAFRLTPLLHKIIRVYVMLAREFGTVIEVPWLWTIKGRGENDPRQSVSVWNEHFIGNEEHGVGVYLRELRGEGDDSDPDTVVEAGLLNLQSELANEYTVHADVFSEAQLRNIARRWHTRDNSGEILEVSQSGMDEEGGYAYDPPFGAPEGYDTICIHPPRGGEWWNAGEVARNTWPHLPINFTESVLIMTQEQWDEWVPQIPKWSGLATTDLERWLRFHEDCWSLGIYTTLHTFRGMDAYWPETSQTRVEDAIRELLGGQQPPPKKTLVLLNAYSEGDADERALEAAQELGFEGIRRDVLSTETDEALDGIVAQSKRWSRFTWLYLLSGLARVSPDEFAGQVEKVAVALKRAASPQNVILELGIEAILDERWGEDPEGYAEALNLAAQRIWNHLPRAKVVANTTDQTSREKLDFVRRVVERLHAEFELGVHVYRVDKTPSDPSSGFSSRDEEYDAIKAVAGDRELWVTEVGWHTAEIRWGLCKGFWSWLATLLGVRCSKRLTEEQVGGYLVEEVKLHERREASAVVIFQAFSGPDPNQAEDAFGLLDQQLQPKPRALLLAEYLTRR